jgi:hypothetical protein
MLPQKMTNSTKLYNHTALAWNFSELEVQAADVTSPTQANIPGPTACVLSPALRAADRGSRTHWPAAVAAQPPP